MSKCWMAMIAGSLFLVGCEAAEVNRYDVEEQSVSSRLQKIGEQQSVEVPKNSNLGAQLLYTMGSDKSVKSAFVITYKEMIKVALEANPKLDKSDFLKREELAMEVIDEEIKVFFSEMGELYETKFTDEELTGLINFYSGDLGQKFVQTESELTRASIPLGEKFGARINGRVESLLKEENSTGNKNE